MLIGQREREREREGESRGREGEQLASWEGSESQAPGFQQAPYVYQGQARGGSSMDFPLQDNPSDWGPAQVGLPPHVGVEVGVMRKKQDTQLHV